MTNKIKKIKKPTTESKPKLGKTNADVRVPAQIISQGDYTLYSFKLMASQAWPLFSISRRDDNEKTGYQRVLSRARVSSVAKYITAGNPIPVSILIAIDKAKFSSGELQIPKGSDVGWVIDGQHRLAGAYEAADKGIDIELPFIAFVGINIETQIKQFLTINNEGRGVPKSLLLDLLRHLPELNTKQQSEERATDIGEALRKNSKSALYSRIVILGSPDKNQISMNNFARKVAPLVHPDKGRLKEFSLAQQIGIFENYFLAIKQVFTKEWTRPGSIFFRTVGFGAWMNLFSDIFDRCLAERHGFRVEDVKSYLSLVEDFDFAQWTSLGSGTKAENLAAADMKTELWNAISATDDEDAGPVLNL